jgi:hypothetical protein
VRTRCMACRPCFALKCRALRAAALQKRVCWRGVRCGVPCSGCAARCRGKRGCRAAYVVCLLAWWLATNSERRRAWRLHAYGAANFARLEILVRGGTRSRRSCICAGRKVLATFCSVLTPVYAGSVKCRGRAGLRSR